MQHYHKPGRSWGSIIIRSEVHEATSWWTWYFMIQHHNECGTSWSNIMMNVELHVTTSSWTWNFMRQQKYESDKQSIVWSAQHFSFFFFRCLSIKDFSYHFLFFFLHIMNIHIFYYLSNNATTLDMLATLDYGRVFLSNLTIKLSVT